MDQLFPLVLEITNPEQRESALLELSKKREAFPDLAPILWHSFGTISALLQEIVSIYPLLSPPALTAHASNRVCNALALLQCVASHTETRTLFLNAHIPLYLYPFLNTVSKNRPFEYLRLTSLGVIGALVKVRMPSPPTRPHAPQRARSHGCAAARACRCACAAHVLQLARHNQLLARRSEFARAHSCCSLLAS